MPVTAAYAKPPNVAAVSAMYSVARVSGQPSVALASARAVCSLPSRPTEKRAVPIHPSYGTLDTPKLQLANM